MDRTFHQRRDERKPVAMHAQCRSQSGLRDTGHIADISAHGCRIETSGIYFRVGTRIVIRPEGLEGLVAVVRWVTNDYTGVEFEAPIYGPVLEHLVAMHAANRPVGLNHH